LLLLVSCSSGRSGAVERVAILPANILIANSGSEWMSRGIALALEQDFATARHISAVLADGESGAYESGVPQVLRTTVEERRGRIHIYVSVTNVASQRVVAGGEVNERSSAGMLATVNALAKRMDPGSTEFSTRNGRAWQAYTAAAVSSNPQERVNLLSEAISDDPAFGLAYLSLLQMSGEKAGLFVGSAQVHSNEFTAIDKARFAALASRISHKPLAEQAKASAAVLQLAPNDVDALATLGSERFIQGDAGEGERLLNRALELSPKNVTIRAQLAEGLLEAQRFPQAERMFTGIDNNPAVLPQLAVCILLEGDAARANTVFTNYLKERAAANDPLLFLAQANWIALSKSPEEGAQYLARNNFSDDNLRSLAASQSAVWELMGKDVGAAEKNATLALQFAKAPTPKLFATIANLVADSGEASEQWRQEVNAAPLDEGVKHAVLAYGLFLNGRYAEAADEWQRLVDQSGGGDLRARAMLASSLDRAGRGEQARKVRVEAFAPNLTGADQFAVLPFTEMRRLLKLKMQ
jgi:Flp pilus assembly protein TadD